MRAPLFAAAFVAASSFAASASAFCGFYVAGADTKLYADASQVVLMREGTRTVLSMQNDYKGPPEKFALVIPVPVVLQKEQVKTLPREVFEKIDTLGAPRLVEYWERDPCETDRFPGTGTGLGGIGGGTKGTGAGGGGGDLGVKVEAKFTVGEYEIVMLRAKDSGGLETWLRDEKYTIPAGSEPYFRPYVQSGSKFFVARVDPAKVKFADGRATLSPLRFHYDANDFTLPVKLGLVNSSGVQDLIVNILAKRQRYDVANYPSVTIPTNLDVAESARGRFAEFYATLFDATLAKNPNAVVTEYAWDAGACDPCPGPTLDGRDVATLGADVLPSGTEGLGGGGVRGDVQLEGAKATRPIADVDRVIAAFRGRFRQCYERGLQSNPKLTGKMTMNVVVSSNGEVESASDNGSTLADKDVLTCIQNVVKRAQFSAPGEGGSTVVISAKLVVMEGVSAPPPTFGGAGNYVLTRLHARYSKDSLGEDLVFKAVPPIVGGREMLQGSSGIEKGARVGPVNNFQGRYAIRHPWTGPIACKEPIRNRWGGPPAGEAGKDPGPLAAQKTAFAPRGQPLETFLAKGVQADIAPATPPQPLSAAPVPSSTSSENDAGAAQPSARRGCGGCTVTRESIPGSWLAGVAIALAALRRRARSTARPLT